MNHIYRSIWNQALGAWVAVSENTKSKSKSSSTRRKLLATGLILCSSSSWALPTGDQLVAGQVNISTPAAGQMQINQTSQQAIVNWQGFSIAPNESVNIQQPNAQAAMLNRVVGQDASQIQGQLHANGQVYLVNPNGVIFGKTAQVDVGGLVASTHNISNADFMAGKNHFTQDGAKGTVENHGTINVPNGGVVALISSSVTNTGTINTPKGTTALAAGKTVDLDFTGDGLVEVKVSEAALNAQITNKGAILADGGRVVLSAKAAGQLVDTVINSQGVIRAQGLVERNGEIILDGGDNGAVKVSGTLNASGSQGGNIKVTGNNIQLTDTAVVDASNTQGGGHITIGDKQTTQQTTLAAGSKVVASTKESGTAGTVEVFADMQKGKVTVQGSIDVSAANKGNGGFIETSAAKLNIADNAKITTKADNGTTGEWLIDPYDFTIAATGGDITGTALGGFLNAANVTIRTLNASVSCSAGVTCGTGNSAGNGDIFVNDKVTWTSNKQLTLNAWRNIYINADINSSAGSLTLLYGQSTSTGGANDNYFVGNGAKIYLPTGQNFSTRKGSGGATTNYQVITSLGAANSNTGTDLQGMKGNLSRNYVLGADIDATATNSWNVTAGVAAGFTPVGTQANPFTGIFDGLGHTIASLTINRPTTDYVGLFGRSTNSIRNIGMVGGNVVGKNWVGDLVGWVSSGSVSNAYATGNITGNGNNVGGLVGENAGVISNSYATGNATGVVNVGGLVGNNWNGVINNAYATGNITGTNQVGGLVGGNNNQISYVYSTGQVSGISNVGGLVGNNAGTISNSFWNTQTSGQPIKGVSTGTTTGVTGKTSAELMTQSTFAGWNISNTGGSSAIWRIYEGYSTPLLRSFLTSLTVTANNITKTYDGLTVSALNTPSYKNTITTAAITPTANLLGTTTPYGTAKNVGTYAAPTGLYSNQLGYDLSYVNGSLTINPATLTAAIANTPTKTYDGTTNATLTSANYQFTGFATGEGASVNQTAGTYNTADVATANAVTANLLAANFTANAGTLLSNYALPTTATGAGNITTAALTAAITGTPTKTYDSTTAATLSATNYGLTGFIGTQGASVNQTAGTYNTADVATANAVTANLLAANFTANAGTLLSNYALPTTATGAGNITTAALTAAITGTPTKTYDSTTAATLSATNYGLTGFIGTQGASVNQTAGTYNTADVATANAVTANLLAANFTANAGTLLSNYALPTTATGAGNITTAALTAAITGTPTKTYDSTTAATLSATNYGLTGFIGTQGASVNQTAGTYNTADVATANAVTANLLAANFTANAGTLLSNYALPTTATGAGNITTAALTAAITGTPTKTYDSTTAATLSATNYGLTGFIGTQGASVNQTAGTYNTADVATANAVTANLLAANFTANAGTLLSNYALPTTATGAGNITTAALTAAITGTPTKTYDSTTAATLSATNYGLTGFIGTQGASVNQTAGTYNTADVATANAVTANLLAANFTANAGTLLSNYALPTTATGAGNITTAALTAAITGTPTKTYDSTTAATLSATNYGLTGFIGTQGASVNQTAGTYNTADVATANAVTANLLAANFTANAGTLLSNYALPTTATGAGNITTAALTAAITGTPTKTYDSTTAATLSATNYGLTGFIGTQGASVNQTAGTYNTADVATANAVTANLLAANFTANAGTLLSNYALPTTATGAGNITTAALTAAITGTPTKTYDSTTAATLSATNYGLTGFIGTQGASVNQTAGTYNTADVATANAVTANLLAANFTANAGTLLSNYALPTTATGAGNITTAALTAAITGTPTKTYDSTTAATLSATNYGLTGFIGTQGASVNQTAGTYNTADVATANAVTANLLAANFTANAGTLLSNYALPTTATGAGNITTAALTAAITGTPTKTYDSTTAATLSATNYGLTGFIGTQGASVNQTAGTYNTADVATANAVTANLLAANFTANAGTLLSNYALPTTATGAGNITPAALTITANNATKTYGQQINFTGTEFVSSGLQNTDTIGTVSLSSAGAAATAHVADGSFGIGVSNAIGGTFQTSNYAITYVSGLLTVNQAALAITANNISKTYGQTYTFAGTEFVSNGLQNTDVIDTVALSSNGAAATAHVANSPYSITASNATGNAFKTSDYNITYTDGGLTVNPAALTITANNISKTYGQTYTFAGTEFVSNGLQNTDVIDTVALSSNGAVATAHVANSPYSITASNATGNAFQTSDYNITYTDGGLTVNPAALTITANNISKTYGQTYNFAGTEFSSSGLQNSDTIGKVNLSSKGAVATTYVANNPYNISASNATGGTFQLSDYGIVYVNGGLTVNPASLIISANNVSKTYDGTTNASSTAKIIKGALFNNDSLVAGSFAFTDKNAGTNKTVTVDKVIINDGNNGKNYTVSYQNNTTSTINKAGLIITANADGKIYDGLAYSGGNGVSYSGFVNGENNSVLAGSLGYAGDSQGAIEAGIYSIIPNGFNSQNYVINYINGFLHIDKNAVNNVGDDVTKKSAPLLVVSQFNRDFDDQDQLVPLQKFATVLVEEKAPRRSHESKARIEIENHGIKLPTL